MAEIEKEEVEFPACATLWQGGIYIRWQHLILFFIYIVQLYKEDWGILRMLGCWAVALPSTEQIVQLCNMAEIEKEEVEFPACATLSQGN